MRNINLIKKPEKKVDIYRMTEMALRAGVRNETDIFRLIVGRKN